MYYGWAVVVAGTIANLVLVGAFYSSFGLFVAPVSEEFKLSRADTNTGLAILSLGIALQAPLLGRMLDRISVRRVMMFGSVVFGATLAALALSRHVWLNAALLGVVFPIAVIGAVSMTVPMLIVRWFTAQTARAMVISQLGLSLGGVLLPPVAAALIEWQGWRTALFIMGIAAGIVLFAVALVMRDWPGPKDKEPGAVGKAQDGTASPPLAVGAILRNPQFWTINLSGALVIGASSAFSISLAPLARGQGLSLVEAATLISVMSASGIVGKLILAIVGDRIDKVLLLTIVYLAGAAATGAVLMTDRYVLLLAAVAPLGLIGGVTSAVLNAVVADRFGRSSFGTVTGLAQPMQSISSMIAFRFAGEVFDRTGGYDLLLLSIVAVKVVAGLVIFATRFATPPVVAVEAR